MGTPIRLAVAACAAALAGCATSYRPESLGNDGGFSEARLRPGDYQVWFVGNEYTAGLKTADLAMLRAAELCVGEGKQFMRISQFHSGAVRTATGPGRVITQTSQVGRYSKDFQTIKYEARTYYIPGRRLYTTRSGLRVACLAEAGDETQDAAGLAAMLRHRYKIASSSPSPPN